MENDVEPLVNPPWWASPWLLLDVRYNVRCPTCGQLYNSQVQTYAANPLPVKCQTSSYGKGQGGAPSGCGGTVPLSAL